MTQFGKASFNNVSIGLLARVLTYIAYMFIAYTFGSQTSTDIFNLGNSFVTVFSGSFIVLIPSVFSPILIRLRTQESFDKALKFAGSVFTWIAIIAVSMSTIAFIYQLQIFSTISKFNLQILKNNINILRYFPIILFLTILVEYVRVYIQSMGKFTVTAIISLSQSLIIILCVLTLSKAMSVESLALAVLLSLSIQLCFLLFYCKVKQIMPLFTIKLDRNFKQVLLVGYPLILSHFVSLAVGLFNDYMITGLDHGTLTSITYARMIYFLPIAIFYTPVVEVVNTKFSEHYFKDNDSLHKQFITIIKVLFFFLVPCSVFVMIFSHEIVTVLLVRGAFTKEAGNITAMCLTIYSFSILTTPFIGVSSKIMFTMQKTTWTSFVGAISHVLWALSIFYMVNRLGFIGVPLARVVSEIVFFVPFTYLFVNHYLKGLQIFEILSPLIKYYVIAFVITMVVHFIIADKIVTISVFPSAEYNMILLISLSAFVSILVYTIILGVTRDYSFKLVFSTAKSWLKI